MSLPRHPRALYRAPQTAARRGSRRVAATLGVASLVGLGSVAPAAFADVEDPAAAVEESAPAEGVVSDDAVLEEAASVEDAPAEDAGVEPTEESVDVVDEAAEDDSVTDQEVGTFGTAAPEDWTVTLNDVAGSGQFVYEWESIEKVLDPDSVYRDESGNGFAEYTVTVVPGGSGVTNVQISGEIEVTNGFDETQQAYASMILTNVDGERVGGCEFDYGADYGLIYEYAPGETKVAPWTCDYSDAVFAGQELDLEVGFFWGEDMGATGGPDDGFSSTQPITLNVEGEVNRTVEIVDLFSESGSDEWVSIGTAEWNPDGTPTEITYPVEFQLDEDGCKADISNSARIDGIDEIPASTVNAGLCPSVRTPNLEAVNEVNATYFEWYSWTVTKDVDSARIQLPAGEYTTEATYTVVATVGDKQVSSPTVSGTVDVTNPSDADETVTVADVDGDLVCEVTEAERTIAAGATETFEYTCAVPVDISLDDEVSTEFTVTPAAGEPTVATATTAFELEGTYQEQVEVVDVWAEFADTIATLRYDGTEIAVDTTEAISSVTVEGGVATLVYTFDIEVAESSGTCVSFENVAQIVAAELILDEATATVDVCKTEPVAEAPDAPDAGAPEEPGVALPPTGSSTMPLAFGGLGLVVLGGGALAARGRLIER